MSEKQEFETIGEAIRFIRKSAGLKQAPFAKELKCSSIAISSYERNVRTPSYAIYARIKEFVKKNKIKIKLP